jgi:hypothetical protein
MWDSRPRLSLGRKPSQVLTLPADLEVKIELRSMDGRGRLSPRSQ